MSRSRWNIPHKRTAPAVILTRVKTRPKTRGKFVKLNTGMNRRNVNTIGTYPFPPKMFTQLVFATNNGLVDSVLSSVNRVYRPTSYFDPNPDLASTETYAGYNAYAAMYGRYRVLAFKYEITFTNLQSDSVLVGVFPMAVASTPSEIGIITEEVLENTFGKYALLGPTAATPQRTIKGYVKCQSIWGTPEVKTDQGWGSATGGSPAFNTWLMIAATRTNGVALSAGVQYTMRVRAYGYWDMKNDPVD